MGSWISLLFTTLHQLLILLLVILLLLFLFFTNIFVNIKSRKTVSRMKEMRISCRILVRISERKKATWETCM